MLDFKGYSGIALDNADVSPEARQIRAYSELTDLRIMYHERKQDFLPSFVPSGSVEWCLDKLGKTVKPDYYPDWLAPHLYRKVWEADKWPFEKVFIKPSDKYKRFDGKCTFGTWKGKKKGPYWCSDIVSFINEWRYYIADGKILCGHWYTGEGLNDPEPPETPYLDIDIPSDYCGCLDFGTLSTGEFALVEAQHPFACGWYGSADEIELYIQWLLSGWKYMNKE